MSEIVPQERKEHQVITADKIISYLDSFGITSQLKDNEKTQFITVAVTYQLDPFKREIYCIPYEGQGGRKLSIITGYEVYLKRAERTADLAGWSVTTEGQVKDGTLKAIVTIHRKSWAQPLVHEVDFTEYDQKNRIWNSKPKTMIKKVGIAQAFRMAFPDEFGGMPYTADELPGEMTGVIDVKPEPTDAPQRKSAAEPIAAPTPPRRKSETAHKAEDTPAPTVHTLTGKVASYAEPKGKSKYWSFTLNTGPGVYLQTADEYFIETMMAYGKSKAPIEVNYEESTNGAYTNRRIVSVNDAPQPAE